MKPLAALLLVAAQGLGAQEQAGRRLYLEGITPSGEPLRALVGMGRAPISGAAVACGNCHGTDGKGRPEASVTPPEITWDELAKPYGHAHGARRHGAFDERSFRRALTEGLDPAGNTLDWAMPRYSLSAAENAALIAYLKRIALERDPGIAERSIRIGAAPAMRPILAPHFDAINRAGGIHQRTLEVVDSGDVFAVLDPVRLQVGEKAFQILAGPAEQAAVLVEFAARKSSSDLKAAVVASGAPPHDQAGQAALKRCGKRGCADAPRIAWYAKELDAAAAVKTLTGERRDQVFFFGADYELARFLAEAEKASWHPDVYAGGGLVRTALAAAPGFGGRIFLAFPTAPPQQPALAVAGALVEGLRRAGRDLSRERFVRSLDSPKALGGYVVALERGGGIAPAAPWIALD